MRGRIVKLDPRLPAEGGKGYGFIEAPGRLGEVFFHALDCDKSLGKFDGNLRRLQVEFDLIEEDDGGARAINVRPIPFSF